MGTDKKPRSKAHLFDRWHTPIRQGRIAGPARELIRFTYNAAHITLGFVIKSFRCRETERIFNRSRSRKFINIERVAFRRLQALDVAKTLANLAGSGMSAELLTDDRAGQYCIPASPCQGLSFLGANRPN
jgi:toxin HigB-1